MDETDDPSGDTAMFRAFVEHGSPEQVETATNRGAWIAGAVVAVLVVLAVVAFLML